MQPHETRCIDGASIVTWRDSGNLATASRDLWCHLHGAGWFSGWAEPVVVQFDRRWHEALVLETRASFESFVRDHAGCTVVPFEPRGASSAPPELGSLTAALGHDSLTVVSPLDRTGVRIPAFWFEAFRLVTIAGAGPDPRCRLLSAMRVAAPALAQNETWSPVELIHESNRLCRADLTVVCGYADRTAPESERWWVAGHSAPGVEAAIARAARISPRRLPHLAYRAKHVVAPPAEVEAPDLPPLVGYAAPAWKCWITNAFHETARGARRLRREVRAIRSNVHRVPRFLARRLQW